MPRLRRTPGGRRFRLAANELHARRLPKGLKPSRPGEIVQIDTLFLNIRPDKAIKHFTAYDPVAKWTVASVATRATASLAAGFLDKLLADFEQACQKNNLALYVLPPKRPQLNGAVERCNGSWRYEFYAVYDLPHRIDGLQPLVDAFPHRFNHHRPYDALDGKTPADYLNALSPAPRCLICPEPGHRLG